MYLLPLSAVQNLLDTVIAKTFEKYIYNLYKNVSIDFLQNIPSVLLLHRRL